MDHARPKSRDFGAALAGLVLGGSVMFLIVLTIVWLTNSHYSGLEHSKATDRPPEQVPVAGPIPSTTGTGISAPVAPTATTQGATPTGTTTHNVEVPSAAAPEARAPVTAQPPPPTKR